MHRRVFGSGQMQLSPSMDHIALARQAEDDVTNRVTPIDIEFYPPSDGDHTDRPPYRHSLEISMSSFSKSPDILPR